MINVAHAKCSHGSQQTIQNTDQITFLLLEATTECSFGDAKTEKEISQTSTEICKKENMVLSN